MDCFHDFCLSCDRESPDGPYCSQSCRLADLERASPAGFPTSQTVPSTSIQQSASFDFSSRTGYILAPAYKFPDRTTGNPKSAPAEERTSSPSQLTLHSPEGQAEIQLSEQQRSLTPSSSRSSLSSSGGASKSKANSISEQDMKELQEYFRSFDQARAARRRQSAC